MNTLQALEIILAKLADSANGQAAIAGNTDNPMELRDQASVHYGTLILLGHALSQARKEILGIELNDLEQALQHAAPPGANPKLHPSMQPPDEPRTPTLRVVKEDFDDRD